MKLWNFFWNNRVQFAKYCVVGATAAVVDFGLLYILTDLVSVHYLLSNTLSFIAAALVNYYLNRKWTFRSTGQKRKQLPIFFTVATAGLFINDGIMFLGVEYLTLHYLWAKVVATGIVTVWNYLGNKFFTFKEDKPISSAV